MFAASNNELGCLIPQNARRKLQRHGVSMLISKQSHLTRVANKDSRYDGEGKCCRVGVLGNLRIFASLELCLSGLAMIKHPDSVPLLSVPCSISVILSYFL